MCSCPAWQEMDVPPFAGATGQAGLTVHVLDVPTGDESPGTLWEPPARQRCRPRPRCRMSMPFVLLPFNKVSVGTLSGGFAMWDRKGCYVSDDIAQSSTP